ncbi:MAG: hypothetical protein AB7L84_16275 [Acidimicrobiia bacterium]
MDILTALRIILRRWHVVLSGLILTAVVAVVVMQSISPTYEAKGSALLVAPIIPNDQPSILDENPWARFDASTSVLAGVTAQLMDDISVRERLQEAGAKPDYAIGQENSAAPIVSVVVEDTDEKVALESTSLVLHAINEELDARQAAANAPEASRIRSIIITEPTRTTRLVAAKVRAGVATVLLGGAAALSLAFVAEGFAQSQAARRASAARERAQRAAEDELDEPPLDDDPSLDGAPPDSDEPPADGAGGQTPAHRQVSASTPNR